MNEVVASRLRPRSLVREVVDTLAQRIRDGSLAPGIKLPAEAAIVAEFGVSRTVVREAISNLQAAGLVEARHGIGTFVVGIGEQAFRISSDQIGTLKDVIAVLELRIAVEAEAAALAAARRTPADVATLRGALDAFSAAVEAGFDAVGPDMQLHLEIARATKNPHFVDLMGTLGGTMIPRARLKAPGPATPGLQDYLWKVNGEHEAIVDAIDRGDPDAARAAMRIHLTNSRDRRRPLVEGR